MAGPHALHNPTAEDPHRALIARLLRSAVVLLARRDYTRAELKVRLLRRGAEDDAGAALDVPVEEVLDRLQAQGYLDEGRFVRSGFPGAARALFILRTPGG